MELNHPLNESEYGLLILKKSKVSDVEPIFLKLEILRRRSKREAIEIAAKTRAPSLETQSEHARLNLEINCLQAIQRLIAA